jgi:ubiquinone/menaquinone biosynthesis C-methylase UbiE
VPGPAIHHPVFARLYTLMSSREPAAITEHRRELLAGLSGRVLELGAGGGANFAHYPAEVSEVVAVEPEPYMRQKALEAAARSSVRITVLQGTADELPAADGSVDAAVACLVLCSVPSQATALAELRRVLRRGGELRFYEHVLSHRPHVARSQRIADRLLWPRAFGGCHTARDTPAAVSAAGFAIEEERRIWLAPLPIAIPVATQVLGRARRN